MNKEFKIDDLLRENKAKLMVGFMAGFMGNYTAENQLFVGGYITSSSLPISSAGIISQQSLNTSRIFYYDDPNIAQIPPSYKMRYNAQIGDIDNNNYTDIGLYIWDGIKNSAFVFLGGNGSKFPDDFFNNDQTNIFKVDGYALSRIGDFDGDGFDDVLVNYASKQIGILFGNSSFQAAQNHTLIAEPQLTINFSPFNVPYVTGPSYQQIGDVNHDNMDDQAFMLYCYPSPCTYGVLIYYGNNVSRGMNINVTNIINTTSTTFIYTQDTGSLYDLGIEQYYAIGDIDHDGYNDIAVVCSYGEPNDQSEEIILLSGKAISSYQMIDLHDLSNIPYIDFHFSWPIRTVFLYSGDINGDNKTDFAISRGYGETNLTLSNGNYGSLFISCGYNQFDNLTYDFTDNSNKILGFGSYEFGMFDGGALNPGSVNLDNKDDLWVPVSIGNLFGGGSIGSGAEDIPLSYLILGSDELCT